MKQKKKKMVRKSYFKAVEEKTFLGYRISSDIRRGFFPFQNNPKDLDPSCKTDLDL